MQVTSPRVPISARTPVILLDSVSDLQRYGSRGLEARKAICFIHSREGGRVVEELSKSESVSEPSSETTTSTTYAACTARMPHTSKPAVATFCGSALVVLVPLIMLFFFLDGPTDLASNRALFSSRWFLYNPFGRNFVETFLWL